MIGVEIEGENRNVAMFHGVVGPERGCNGDDM